MADDHTQRKYRSDEYPRTTGRTPANDPLAELARLIGQNDPFAEFGHRQPPASDAVPHRVARQPAHQDWAPEPYAASAYEQQGAPAEPYPAAPETTGYDQGAPAYEGDAYYPNGQYAEDQPNYDDAPPTRRRLGVIAIAAVLALAVVGTAGAFGYRALFGSGGSLPPPVIKAETTPTKVVPPSKSESQSTKLIYDRVGERSAGEKLVSREEQPVDISKPTQASLMPGANQASIAPAGAAAMPSVDQPKKVHTIVIRPDQPQTASADPASTAAPAPRAAAVPTPEPAPAPAPVPAPPPRASAPQRLASAPPTATADAADNTAPVARPATRAPAPSRNAPLSLNPNAQPPAQAEPVRTASAPPARNAAPAAASATGHYAVQISSQRSEAEAQAAFRALQAKYPAQLSGRQPIIRRADLGSKGIYYRAMVGPFASAGEASALCQSLKAAGGSCLIQKN